MVRTYTPGEREDLKSGGSTALPLVPRPKKPRRILPWLLFGLLFPVAGLFRRAGRGKHP